MITKCNLKLNESTFLQVFAPEWDGPDSVVVSLGFNDEHYSWTNDFSIKYRYNEDANGDMASSYK